MSKNFIQPGDVLNFTAPYDVLSGHGFKVGTLFGVAGTDALSGGEVAGAVEGVFELAKVAAQAWTQGQTIYWDDGAKLCTTTASTNLPIGHASEAAANPSSVGRVNLESGPPGVAGPSILAATVALANGDSGYIISPVAGTVARIDGVLTDGAVATADALVTPKIGAAGSGVAMTSGAFTVTSAASAIGDKDGSVPSAANVVAAGDLIYFTVSGGPTGGRHETVSLLITP